MMKSLYRRYFEALRQHLSEDAKLGAAHARDLGREAIADGLETLELARVHEAAFALLIPARCSPAQMKATRRRSRSFFLAALRPFDQRHRSLKQEVIQRKAAEAALIKSEGEHTEMLRQSRITEHRMRLLSRQILSAQEEERKKISREVHDQIAQMLAGINVHLATLKSASSLNSEGLHRKLRNTQRMVEKSVDVVHRFARELRPPVLDDLGLIPALQAHFKSFTKRTGILIRLTVFAGVEELDSDKRTVLYRVAQAAITNVAQHAKASRIAVTILPNGNTVEMLLHDNGRGFDAHRALFTTQSKRLGLIGMRERIEMVGGTFSLESSSAGTIVGARIPFLAKQRPEKAVA
jgi:signal transduction histidine kinase